MDETIKELSRIEEDAEISSKRHFNEAKCFQWKHTVLGLPLATLAAMASLSAFSQFSWGSVAAGVISFLVAILTAVTTFLAPGEKAQIHNQAGASYLALRNRTRIFRNIEMMVKSEEDKIKFLLELNATRDELNRVSPQTSKKSFDKALAGKVAGETDYAVDQQISNGLRNSGESGD